MLVWDAFTTNKVTYKPCHVKTGPKIFVVVLPKESLVGTSAAMPSFDMTPTSVIYTDFFQ